MNSPLRTTPDMKADGAERASILLANGDAIPAAARGGIMTLERSAGSGALDDIVAARMKDLADRLAAGHEVPKTAGVDAPLEQSDVVIQPVSLAAITGLRGRPIADSDDDGWLPMSPTTLITPPTPSQRADDDAIAPPPAVLSTPTESSTTSEAASERNLRSLLDVLDPPAPLRLAGEIPSGRLGPAALIAEHSDDVSDPPVVATWSEASSRPSDAFLNADRTTWGAPTPVTDEPLMLADQSDSDIRLVDLIKRQQSLLDQLNRYPPSSVPADSATISALADLPTAPAWSVVDQLAPPLPTIPAEQHRASQAAAPPPLPSTGILRLAGPLPDDAEQRLTERSPMIIERARAEQSARHGLSNSTSSSSPLPAFAAGVAIAFAIAGSLLLVL